MKNAILPKAIDPLHGYPIYATWSSGPTDERLVPFLTDVTAWLAGGAPVLFEEFGHPTAPPGQTPVGMQVSEAEAAEYVAATLDALRRSGSIGALLWCYADYRADLFLNPRGEIAAVTLDLWEP